MHLERCKPVEDAVWLHEGQHVLMASGKAAVVAYVDAKVIQFNYLGPNPKAEDCVIVPRHRVPDLVRV